MSNSDLAVNLGSRPMLIMNNLRNRMLSILPIRSKVGLIRYLKRNERHHPLVLIFSGSRTESNGDYFDSHAMINEILDLIRFLKKFYSVTNWRNFTGRERVRERRLFIGFNQLSITALKKVLPILRDEGICAVIFCRSDNINKENSSALSKGLLAASAFKADYDIEFGISYNFKAIRESLERVGNRVENIQKQLSKILEQPVPYLMFEENMQIRSLVLFLRMQGFFDLYTVQGDSNTDWTSVPDQIFHHCEITKLYKGIEVELSLRPTVLSSIGDGIETKNPGRGARDLSDSNYPLF